MHPLGSTKEVAENKLIILYLINKLEIPLSNIQITRVILENRIMNYFLLQQFLNELLEGNFLEMYTQEGRPLYKITEAGRQSLSFFSEMVPLGIKAHFDGIYKSLRKNIRNETLINADFTPVNDNEFIANCKVGEDDFLLMEINVTVGTKTDAKEICSNWKAHSQEIYSEIINILTKKRD